MKLINRNSIIFKLSSYINFFIVGAMVIIGIVSIRTISSINNRDMIKTLNYQLVILDLKINNERTRLENLAESVAEKNEVKYLIELDIKPQLYTTLKTIKDSFAFNEKIAIVALNDIFWIDKLNEKEIINRALSDEKPTKIINSLNTLYFIVQKKIVSKNGKILGKVIIYKELFNDNFVSSIAMQDKINIFINYGSKSTLLFNYNGTSKKIEDFIPNKTNHFSEDTIYGNFLDMKNNYFLMWRAIGNNKVYKYGVAIDNKAIQITSLQIIIIVIIIGFILALFTAVYVYNVLKVFLKPLITLSDSFEKLSKGDFDIVLDVNSEDEIGKLIGYFNSTVEKMKKSILAEREYILEKQKREISEKWALELDEKNIELENSYRELKAAQEQLILSEKMAVLGGLVAGVAHEINTPLGICLTTSTYFKDITNKFKKEFSNDELTEEGLIKYVDKSIDCSDLLTLNITKAADLIKSFKQISVDQTAEAVRIFDLLEYINEIVRSLHPKLKKIDIKVNIKVPESIKINSYPGAFSQIFTNLIMNSVIHGFEGMTKGEISIIVTLEEDELVLEYKDNGHGIDEKDKAKIYEPFYTTKRNMGGTGLGTYIIYNIVTQKLKGKIECESSLGNGIYFVMRIPKKNNYGLIEIL